MSANLTDLQREILTAIQKLEPNAYGLTIFDALDESHSFGTIYATLDVLEDECLITSEHTGATVERGYRNKRIVRLTKAGAEALKA